MFEKSRKIIYPVDCAHCEHDTNFHDIIKSGPWIGKGRRPPEATIHDNIIFWIVFI